MFDVVLGKDDLNAELFHYLVSRGKPARWLDFNQNVGKKRGVTPVAVSKALHRLVKHRIFVRAPLNGFDYYFVNHEFARAVEGVHRSLKTNHLVVS